MSDITHDSYSTGWQGDVHYRELLLIQSGKVLYHEEKSDDWLRSQFSHGNTIVEHHIIDWAKTTIKRLKEEVSIK